MANEPSPPSAAVVERKLVTILSADVAEYSRLMAEDEEHTLRVFREHIETVNALVDMHHGRIFNTAGDAFLAEFTSPVEAVRCATDIQAALRTRNDQLAKNKQVRFRIGINLGDVMTHNSDLLGDGVNVAARLQGAAEPGGICISGSVYDQIRNKLSLNIASLGERHFKNIPQPVRTFTIAGSEVDDSIAIPAPKTTGSSPGINLPTKPLAIGAAVLLVVGGGYWLISSLPHSKAGKPAPAAAATTAAAAKSTGTKVVAAPIKLTLDKEASGLLGDAQQFKRPKSEIDDLTDSNAKIAALATQIRGLKPADKAKIAPLLGQMNSLATDMAGSEEKALERGGNAMWRDIERPLGRSAGSAATAAVAAASDAKSKLDDALTAEQQAKDGASALDADRQALKAYDAFDTAYGTAEPFYVSAKRSDFAAMAVAAHNISDRVVAYSKVNKPWLFASHDRKTAYQTLVDNATAAQSEIAQMDELQGRAATANELKKISAAMSKAASIKSRLTSLLSTSTAAYAVVNQ
jgi:class 3 adenylate cyclase